MFFSKPVVSAVTIPNQTGQLNGLMNLEDAFQATLKVFGAGGTEDFSGGYWVVDYTNDGSTYVPIPGSEFGSPKVISLPMPAAFCRVRCLVAPADIAKTPLAALTVR